MTISDSLVQYSGGWGIRVSNAPVVISRTQVLSTTSDGIYAERSDFILADSILENNGGHGIYISNASPTLTGNRIVRPRQYGIYVERQTSAVITDNVIEHGLFFQDGSPGASLTGNTVSGLDEFPLRLGAGVWGQFLAENQAADIEESLQIELIGERLMAPAVWQNVGPTYVIMGAPIEVWGEGTPVTLTLSAGVRLAFDQRTYLWIGNGANQPGTLIAQGSESQPIFFTSARSWPAPGDWRGIEFRAGTTRDSVLSGSVVEFGGNNITITNARPLLEGNTIRYAAAYGIEAYNSALADVRDNTIVSNGQYGISLSNASNMRIQGNTIEHGILIVSSLPLIADNTFINYRGDYLLRIPFVSPSADLRGNRFEGTDETSHIRLFGEWADLTDNLTLPFLGLPYIVVDRDLSIGGGGNVTIEPGVEMRFNRNLGLNVRADGRLFAIGTAEAPIIFTASDPFPEPGDWRGILIESRDRSILEGCQVRYAGGGDVNLGAVHIAVPWSPLSDSAVRHCRIEQSLAHALTVDSAQPIIVGNEFVSNGGFELYNIPSAGRQAVVATLNWWGQAEGPLSIGDGFENEISDAVVVNPWLIDPVGAAAFQSALVIPSLFSPLGGQTTFMARLGEPAEWTLVISDAAGNEVHSATGSGDQVLVTWDGKGDGDSLPAGIYPFRLSAEPAGKPVAEVAGRIVLDPDLPAAAITAPTAGTMLSAGPVDVRGTAAAADLSLYRLEYASADSPRDRTIIASVSDSTVTDDLLAQWDTTSLPTGNYLLYLIVENSANQQTTVLVPVTIDSIAIADVSVSSHDMDPKADETVTISYTLSDQAAVTVSIGEHIVLAGEVQDSGSHSITWDGLDADGNPVEEGAYFYTILAEDETGRRAMYSEPAVLTPMKVEDLTVIRNEADDTLVATYTLTLPADILLLHSTPAPRGGVGPQVDVVPHDPRGLGMHTEVWQVAETESQNLRIAYHIPAIRRAVRFSDLATAPPPTASPPEGFDPRADYWVSLNAWALPSNVIIVRSPPSE